MQKINALDTLENITNQLEYLVSTHYSFLHEIQEGGLNPKSTEINGYMDLHNGIVKSLKTFQNDLKPLLFPNNKISSYDEVKYEPITNN